MWGRSGTGKTCLEQTPDFRGMEDGPGRSFRGRRLHLTRCTFSGGWLAVLLERDALGNRRLVVGCKVSITIVLPSREIVSRRVCHDYGIPFELSTPAVMHRVMWHDQ